tara:strand:+ start:3252 stop:3512 length:261 start_codon:yes stop_codon:yes gene_type:complete
MIKKGTPCFLTTTGHNNFYYPLYSEEGLTYFEKDIENPEIKTWVCGRSELAAVIVSPDKIRDLFGTGQTVVWVEKRHLKNTKVKNY